MRCDTKKKPRVLTSKYLPREWFVLNKIINFQCSHIHTAILLFFSWLNVILKLLAIPLKWFRCYFFWFVSCAMFARVAATPKKECIPSESFRSRTNCVSVYASPSSFHAKKKNFTFNFKMATFAFGNKKRECLQSERQYFIFPFLRRRKWGRNNKEYEEKKKRDEKNSKTMSSIKWQ